MNIDNLRKTQIFTPEKIVRDMIKTVPSLDGEILDLCAGEGIFTEVLIGEFNVNPKNITLIEIDPDLCRLLRDKFPFCNIIEGDLFEATEGLAGKFDVVFSNPPYQVMDGGGGAFGNSSVPVYSKIVEYIIEQMRPKYVSMITPSRWMIGGKGLDEYRNKVVNDFHLSLVQDFPGTNYVFKSVAIAGGVSYFLWDKDYKGKCNFNGVNRFLNQFDIVVRDNTAVSILKKILVMHPANQFCDQKVLPQKPFGLRSNVKEKYPKSTEGTVKCHAKCGEVWNVKKEIYTDKHNIKDLWKVCIVKARSQGIVDAEGNGEPSLVIGNYKVIPMGEICSETFLVADSFNNEYEAKNYLSYVKTKFYRFMLMLRLISQNISKDKFAWVPDLQDYSKAWTDQELYQHFGLTKKEIDHIESTIKELK